jgi:hypothetical protein
MLCHYAVSLFYYAACHYAKCRYTNCRYAECCGAPGLTHKHQIKVEKLTIDKHSSLLQTFIYKAPKS